MSQPNQMPIWLRQMHGWEDTPRWLLELIMQFEQGPGFEGLEDLPSDLGFETGGAAPSVMPEGDDWLSKLEAEVPVEEAPTGPAPTPDWLAGLETEAPPSGTPDVSQEGVPDWLSNVETKAPSPEAESVEKEDVPDWLTGFEDRLAAREEQEAAGETEPDWLSDVEAETSELETGPAGEAEMPGWLSQFESGTDTTAEEAQEPASEPEVQEAGLPDWLSGLETEAPDWLSQAGVASTTDTAPDWLAEFEQEVITPLEAEEPAAQEPPAQEPAPDWLDRLQPEVPEVEPAEGEAPADWLSQVSAGAEEPAVPEPAPDWLSRLQPEARESEPTEEEALPDWLSQASAEAEEPEVLEPAPDWLDRLQPEAPETEATEEEALPGWLSQASAEAEEPLAQEPAPDWLDRLQPEAPESESTEEEMPAWDQEPPAREEGVPDWLARMAVESPGPEAEFAAPPDDQEVNVPDWLVGLEPAQEPETSDQDQGVPDWLAQMTADLPDQERPEEPSSEPEEGVPSWLAGMGTGRLAGEEASLAWLDEQLEPAPQEPAAEQPAPPQEEEDAPGWLQDMGEVSAVTDSLSPRSVTDWLHGIQEMPVPPQPVSEEPAEEPVLPGWLQELETTVPAQSAETASVSDEPVEIPDWLREVPDEAMQEPEVVLPERDQEPQVELPVTPSWMQEVYTLAEKPAPADDVLSLPERESAEVPDWLEDLRPEQVEAPVPIAEGREETSGPLMGLRGVLDPEPLLAIFPKSTYRPVPPVPEEQLRQVAVVEQLLSEPAARPRPPARATGRLVVASLGRWAMYLVILATLMIAPLRTWVRPPEVDDLEIPALLESSSFRDAIGGLEPGSEVLLVVDYDPALDGEMTPLARAVIWHLFRQDLGIVTVSLTPQGTAMVQGLFDEHPSQLAGASYVNLGYLPAHPASLQAFALDPLAGATFSAPEVDIRQAPLGQRIGALSDMDLVVLLSGDPSRVRWWIEQVAILGPMDMVAGVSMAAAPYVFPYYSSGQLKGMLAGLPVTAQYEDLIGADFAPSSRENFIVAANLQLLLAAVLVLAAVFSAIRGRRKAS